jgi:NAD(P)-dependent dehydrogenase (short-subunit alcohol dehydrogenase family)
MASRSRNKWTVDNIPDLSGKVIIVTGANCGLGFASSKEFARKGAKVIMACRSMEKGQAALNQIIKEIPNASAEVMWLDLARLKSIHQFAKEFKAKYNHLDVLLNNAGIMFTPYGKTEDGFEQQFGVNHLGHFALTGHLLDVLKKTSKSRVVNVSSSGHTMGEMDFDDLMFENNGYGRQKAYGRSKLANLLFTYELQRRFENAGINSISVAAHPGASNTNLSRHVNRILYAILLIVAGPLTQIAARGALPQIRASVDPDLNGGEYYGPDGFNEMRGFPVLVQSNAASHNIADAKKLWEVSEELTQIKYDFNTIE